MIDRLYVSDLDKTLLRTDMSLSTFTIDIWNALVDREVKLTVATARSGIKTREVLQKLRLKYPLIVMDGAMIISPEGDTLMAHTLSAEVVDVILGISAYHDISPFVIGSDDADVARFRYSKVNALQQELLHEYQKDKRLQYVKKLTPLKENVKIVYIGEKAPIKKLKEEFVHKLGDSVEIKCQKDVYLDGYFLTILHPKGDKAHALESLKEMIGIGHEKLTVFGDSSNDMGMFALANEKIAVDNAIDELKNSATEILPDTNDEDAVAKYLQKRAKNLL